jgi:hypothetical protein
MAYESKTGSPSVFVPATDRSACAWRGERVVRVGAEAGLPLDTLIDEFLDAAKRGSPRDRYGRPSTGDAIRELRWCLDGHVREELGVMRAREVRRDDVEALVYKLGNAGISRRRLRAVAKSVRALFDFAAEQRLVRKTRPNGSHSPTKPRPSSRPAAPLGSGRPSTGQSRWRCSWPRSASLSSP